MRSIILAILIALGGCSGAVGQPPPLYAPAFFVAANGGSDSNPGTLAQPFATPARAQAAMRASGTIKTVNLRAGVYMLTSKMTFDSSDSGETWQTYPGDADQAAVLTLNWNNTRSFMFVGNNVLNITFTNLTISGGSTGGGAQAGVFMFTRCRDVAITRNHFIDNAKQVDITVYNSDYISINSNTSDLNEYQFVAFKSDDGRQHRHLHITDNISTNFSGELNDIYVFGRISDLHVDRNTVVAPNTNDGTILISVVDIISTGPCNTISGNILSGPNTSNLVGIEVAALRGTTVTTSVENNVLTNVPLPFVIGEAVGVGVSNNMATGSTTAFTRDGGWNATEWIGTNMVNGSVLTTWAGRRYGVQPPACAPSPLPS